MGRKIQLIVGLSLALRDGTILEQKMFVLFFFLLLLLTAVALDRFMSEFHEM